jgi:molybdopterin-guanine dinucleotide biosynthesis protein A
MREITGLILAGGQGRRMGGVDKGLTLLRGRPMIAWVLERLAPQVDELLINANQNLAQYRSFGHPVISDEIGGFAGPLAGLHAGMKTAHGAFVLMVPCDSPFLPTDLAQRLFDALDADHADVAVAKSGAQPYPVFALARTSLRPGLAAFLEGGGRTVYAWYDSLKLIEVAFDDQEHAFTNINTTDELKAIEFADSSESRESPT